MVCGPNKSYLWILSRTPQLNDSIKSSLLNKAKALGFDIGKLIFVKQ
jgi:apolipoprotein D and lipocalin family protein